MKISIQNDRKRKKIYNISLKIRIFFSKIIFPNSNFDLYNKQHTDIKAYGK